jgi:hypothetical protein
MVNDIIKNILFKLKGDSKDFDKEINESFKNVKKKYDDTFSSPQAKKTLDTFAKNISKNNMDLSAGFSKYAGVVKKFNESELATLERKAQRYSKLIEGLEVKIKNSKNEAEKEGYIKKQSKAFGRAVSVAGKYNSIKDGIGDDDSSSLAVAARAFGIPVGPAAIAAMAAATAIKVAKDIINSPMSRLQTTANLTSNTEAFWAPGASGNLSKAFYLANNKGAMKSAEDAVGINRETPGCLGISPDLKDFNRQIWAGYESLISGFKDGVYGAKLEELRGSDTGEALSLSESSNLKASKILPYLQSKAASRLQLQEGMNLNDNQFYYMKDQANRAGLNEGEFTGTSMALRSRLGQVGAMEAAISAGETRRETGMSLETISGMQGVMGSMGISGESSGKKIAEMIREAMSKGLEDYGLAENIVKAGMELSSRTNNIGIADYNSARAAQILQSEGNPTDAKSEMANASPRNQTITFTKALLVARKLGKTGQSADSFARRVAENPEILSSLDTDEFSEGSSLSKGDLRNIGLNARKEIFKAETGNRTEEQFINENAHLKNRDGKPMSKAELRAQYRLIQLPEDYGKNKSPRKVNMDNTVAGQIDRAIPLATEDKMSEEGRSVTADQMKKTGALQSEFMKAGLTVSATGDQMMQAMTNFLKSVQAALEAASSTRAK